MTPSNHNPMSSAQSTQSCAETVHELANVMTAVLMNSQVLDWKLPPYSRLKRPVREIERHAQRGGELLKRLQRQLVPVSSPEGAGDGEFCGQAAGPARGSAQGPDQGLTPRHGGGEAQEPGVVTARQANLPPAAPGFSLPE